MKPESLQTTGSFKLRGASHAALLVHQQSIAIDHESTTTTNPHPDPDPSPTIPTLVTYSSGNHGLALAYAARQLAMRCAVVAPQTAPASKLEGMRALGAELHLTSRSPAERQRLAQDLAAAAHCELVPPFDDRRVVLGQASLGLELAEQAATRGLSLGAVLVPVSGGGLATGVASALRALSPATHVYAVAPAGKALETSLATGRQPPPSAADAAGDRPLATLADGMQTNHVGRHVVWPLLQPLLQPRVLAVNDADIRQALRLAAGRLRLVLEPSGATPIAALLAHRALLERYASVALILSGGNTDLGACPPECLLSGHAT